MSNRFQKKESKTISIVVPRTTWTFSKLPNEDDEAAELRFLYSCLCTRENLRKFAELVLQDSYVSEDTGKPLEVNADWTEQVPKVITKEAVDNLLQYVKR